jgi:hypothetical protein
MAATEDMPHVGLRVHPLTIFAKNLHPITGKVSGFQGGVFSKDFHDQEVPAASFIWRVALARSWVVWRFIQKRAVVPRARERRMAVSAVMARSPQTI